MLSLNENSGFNRLYERYRENEDKHWSEWLDIETFFQRPGKQGIVGVMKAKGDETQKYVFKVSQHIDYLIHHEISVMQSLRDIADFCPHFCRVIGNLICPVNPKKKKTENVFDCRGASHVIEKEVLLMEQVRNSSKFFNYITSGKSSENTIYAIVRQTLMAISIANKKVGLTHYDLHSNNVMIKGCDKDLVFLYVMDDGTQICVPSHGFYPIIIDYGFAYSNGMEGGPLWSSMNYTNYGFTSDRPDIISDLKLFLVTVSGEIDDTFQTKRSKKFRNIVVNNFSSLNIDWFSGWEIDEDDCITDRVLKKMRGKEQSPSLIFREYEYYCIDILQTLVTMPAEHRSTKDTEHNCNIFLREFLKIEAQISTPYCCLYILKGIIDAARVVRPDYMNRESRVNAVKFFRMAILEKIDSIASYCVLEDVDYEIMLCSLICLGKNIEGIFHKQMEKISEKKEEDYKDIPLRTPEQIIRAMDCAVLDNYAFSTDTQVMVIDCRGDSEKMGTCSISRISEKEADIINCCKLSDRGGELYKIIKKFS